MDDRVQRLVIDSSDGEGLGYFGFEAADAAALDRLASRVEVAGLAVDHDSRALADKRQVDDLIAFHDPAGHRVEVVIGPHVTSDPFVPGRPISGSRDAA